MPKTARSVFVIDHKEGQPAKWEGGQMGHNRFEKSFTGELAGIRGSGEILPNHEFTLSYELF